MYIPPPADLPLVSVIVAGYGQLHYTKGLAVSLAQHAGCRYELIVVDNGCPDGTAAWAAAKGIRFHRFPKNEGVPRAYNQGVKLARGGILAFFNNDMVCHPDGLGRLAQAALERGLAAQSAGAFTLAGDYQGCTGDASWADYAEGYALACTREVWDRTGEWDETFFPSYSDDADWVLRARLQGYDFKLVPGCVEHYGQATSSGMDLRSEVREHAEIIRRRYLKLGLGQRIAVLRWGAAGDLIMATPVLRALKRELPLARIHVHCEPGCGQVLARLPYVDRVFQGAFNPGDYSRVVDLNGAYEWPQRFREFQHPVQAYCRRANVEFDGEPYDFSVPAGLNGWAEDLLPDDPDLIYVGCGLRSGTRDKQNWNGWLSLARAMPENWRLVALDSARRPPLGRTVPCPQAAFYEHPRVVDLTGKTLSLAHTGALLARCRGFIGVDSGLLHVATSLQVPVVCVCAAAPLDTRLPLVGVADGFSGKAPCFPCQYRDECPDRHCLDYVTGPMAVRALQGLWDAAPHG